MSIYKNICPIPFDQQPLNEYIQLKQDILFSWSTKDTTDFIKKIVIIFLVIVITTSMITLLIVYENYMSSKLIMVYYNTIFATLVIKSILVRLYLGWSYVLKRLLSATVFYEESGWYDGQLWVKPAHILIQDRLIGIYQVMPIMQKIKKFFLLNTFFFGLQIYLFIFFN
jgi:Conserved in the green lineage and diatoms 27